MAPAPSGPAPVALSARSGPLAPEEFSVAAEDGEDGGGLPLWVLPLAGVVLAGAGCSG